ncbi:MAG: hypothetical protein ABIT01_09120, partial [Thermoanaerobaculia bacterium]
MLLEGVVSLSGLCVLGVLVHTTWPGLGGRTVAGLGAALLILISAFLVRRWTPLRAARRLERENPALQDGLLAFVTAPDSALHLQLESWLLAQRPRAKQRGLRLTALLAVVFAGLSLAWSLRARAPLSLVRGDVSAPARPLAKAMGPHLEIEVRTQPPRYTGLPAQDALRSERGGTIEVIAGSRVTLRIRGDAAAPFPILWTAPGSQPERLTVPSQGLSRSWVVSADQAFRIETAGSAAAQPETRLLLFRARADRPPEVELVSPAEDRTLHAAPAPFTVQALATDDFGIAATALRYTLAHGRGEGMTFKNGVLPATEAAMSARSRRVTSPLDPQALGFKLGDTLVLWAEASDRNDVTGPGLTRSSPRVLRWEDATSTIDMPQSASLALAREAPLSERELLKRTKRLVAAHASPKVRADKALELAELQRGIRLRFAVFTREENADSTAVMDVETAETNPLGPPKQEHLLARAVDAMWRAERALSAAEPENAVLPEQDAIRLLDDAFGRERISLTALAAPSAPVDFKKRLTGDAKGLKPAPDS